MTSDFGSINSFPGSNGWGVPWNTRRKSTKNQKGLRNLFLDDSSLAKRNDLFLLDHWKEGVPSTRNKSRFLEVIRSCIIVTTNELTPSSPRKSGCGARCDYSTPPRPLLPNMGKKRYSFLIPVALSTKIKGPSTLLSGWSPPAAHGNLLPGYWPTITGFQILPAVTLFKHFANTEFVVGTLRRPPLHPSAHIFRRVWKPAVKTHSGVLPPPETLELVFDSLLETRSGHYFNSYRILLAYLKSDVSPLGDLETRSGTGF